MYRIKYLGQGLLEERWKGRSYGIYHQSIEQSFLEANRTYKVVLVVGSETDWKDHHDETLVPRLKIALMYPLMICIRGLLADTEPDLFFEIFRPPVIINEIHFAPSILHKMKEICEQSEESGLFLAGLSAQGSFYKKTLRTYWAAALSF